MAAAAGAGGAGGMSSFGSYMQIAGMAYNTVSAFFSSRAQKENLRAQQVMAESNARLAERGAQTALWQGGRAIGALTLARGQEQGQRRAHLAKSGVDMGEGSAAEVQASAELMKDWEAQDLRTQALYQAFGYRQQAMDYQNQAYAARSAKHAVSPWLNVAGSLLSSASEVDWSRFGKNDNTK